MRADGESGATGLIASAIVGGLAVLMLPVVVVAATAGSSTPDGGEVVGDVAAGAIPARYRDAVLAAGAKCKEIGAPVIAAQIEAESGWRPDAGSPAGAQGISQFMPGTWSTWGKDYSGDGVADVFDPVDAIGSQGDMMCALAAQVTAKIDTGVLDGDPLELALAAYNAGMGNVTKYRGVPPFPETQNYVKKITTAARTKFSTPTTVTGAGGGGATGPVQLPVAKGKYVNRDNYGSSGSLWARHHTGTDYSAPCGTPVRAVHAGVVVHDRGQSGWAGPNFVKISTGAGNLATWYAHMMRLAVADGQQVAAGEVIGYVGTLGNSTGCHLHLEVHPKGGRYAQDDVDPNDWLRKKGLTP
ncbi:peptidoglycan DD-metalloendopeptidase family protein [Solicola sp. PLA-1-18]|uniref:peptidoglycan DD-metalloendopeptidase family protein n=1 Tax=Solicola sp. PLA-1-18 TaxID=3380532 RepID=UPI003B7E1E28